MEEKRAEIEAEKASTCKTCSDPERAEVENLLKGRNKVVFHFIIISDLIACDNDSGGLFNGKC
jgi:hypothetical protein